MKITICTETPGDVLNGIALLQSIQGMSMTNVAHAAPQTQTSSVATTEAVQTINEAAPQREAGVKPTVEQLIAGMTLKPTESSTIDGGHKISKGDYVVFNDDDWRVEATYRGTIVAINEAGTADIIKTADCTKSNIVAEPAAPRAGTAAALLPNEQATGPVSGQKAAELREAATAKVSGGKVDVNAVFNKLGEFGVQTIDQLSAANAALFEQWLSMAGEEPPAGNPAFGF